MARELNLVAFDCGNSSVRTMLCRYDGEVVKSELILQEPNYIVEEDGIEYWDMDAVAAKMKKGLGMAAKKVDKIDSVGVCTWGIDFQMTGDDDEFVEKSFCYRNPIGAGAYNKLSEEEKKAMFYRTGILCDKINTVFMIKGLQDMRPDILEKGRKILIVPDILVYMFTGAKINEPSEFSTTQFLDVKSMTVNKEQCEYAGVDPSIFSEIGVHGQVIANIKQEVLDELGIDYDIPFVCVPSHDTACAVLAVPTPEDEYIYVSAGTWSLIGAQCPEPIINDDVYKANLTNEVGAFGRTTLLRNSGGMFIIQRLKAEYQNETGTEINWGDFTAMGTSYEGEKKIFDVNDIRLFNPKKMVDEINKMIHGDDTDLPYSWPEILSSTYASMGTSYATVLKTVIACTGKEYDRVNIVGGGSRNAMICQWCADGIGMPVAACDMECSSVGNAVVQLSHFHPEYSYEKLRQIISDSLQVKMFYPAK